LAHTYTTAIAERATITLRDGSQVQLAPASRLSVVDGYGATSRTVVLSGEAFFDVAHAQGAPFVVRTGSVSTRVLGTAFDVRHYPDDPHVRVAVVSGKVESGGSRTPVTLTAGIVGFVTDSTARTMSGDVAAYSGWTRDRLVFEDASVRAVLASVGRWYGYEFRLRDSALANQHMSAAFKLSDPAQMMQSLKQLLEVTMTFDGRVVTLSPRRKSAAPSEPRRTRDDVILPFTEVGR
jgi:ferric-dicitrate binding protein FerR (iron transport regulator)